ncbi:hypothetical protein D3C72_791080 [compost metagenome]
MQHQVGRGIDCGAPARFDHSGASVLQQDGRAVHGDAGRQGVAAIDGRVAVLARHANGQLGDGVQFGFAGRQRRRRGLIRTADGLDLQRLDHQGLALGEEAEAATVQGLERFGHLGGRTEGHDQRRIGPGELDLGAGEGGDDLDGEALGFQIGAGCAG